MTPNYTAQPMSEPFINDLFLTYQNIIPDPARNEENTGKNEYLQRKHFVIN